LQEVKINELAAKSISMTKIRLLWIVFMVFVIWN